MIDQFSFRQLLAVLVGMGIVIGIGKLLASDEKFSWRLAIGRAIVSAGLAVAAGALAGLIPGLSQLAIIGFAAASAVLGEQFLEKLIHLRAGGSQ
ncbi:holin [Caballeronia sp. LZ033]|uniref:holin n=1 Tax=Caballeronia sp. LZ033 TaxID=3038566 RepID=UPI00285B4F55|nr:holin [Caballeronia sp. LZ033]MDR5812025.1 holin [Caballeronia sp. LZ033]